MTIRFAEVSILYWRGIAAIPYLNGGIGMFVLRKLILLSIIAAVMIGCSEDPASIASRVSSTGSSMDDMENNSDAINDQSNEIGAGDNGDTDKDDGICRVGDILSIGDSCIMEGTDFQFKVERHRVLYGSISVIQFEEGGDVVDATPLIDIMQDESWDFIAHKQEDGTWKIDRVPPVPSDETVDEIP